MASVKSKALSVCVAALALVACRRAPTPPPASTALSLVEAPPVTPPPEAQRTADGLASLLLQSGTGNVHPEPQDIVEVHYVGWSQGKVFANSIERHAPTQFEVSSAIRGWSEGVALMVEGEKRRLWIPEKLVYGDRPTPSAPRGDLIFDMQLLKVIKKPRLPDAPLAAELSGPPSDAQKLPSGLAYRVMARGTGEAPALGDTVEVNYTGWSADGRMFDSTVPRQQPWSTKVGAPGSIPGWTEALTHLSLGAKSRFWLPAQLGYGNGITGGPNGPLVYDVELVGLHRAIVENARARKK
jgi:FKBP-type peptidyl-prolyl cis-trans isomerase